MITFIVRRVFLTIPTLLGIVTLVFISLHLIPGDPARIIAGLEADAQTVENVRRELGLDRPIWEQYFSYLGRIVQGDLGRSFISNAPVIELILGRYPRTIILAISAVLLALLMGIPLGVVAALKPYSITDNASTVVALLGISLPGFWLGLMLIYLFGITLEWLPVVGLTSPRHLVMPAFVLSFFSLAFIARITRSGMIEVLQQEYIVTARAKGLRENAVLWGHALKNALIPVISIAGLSLGYSLGGSVIIESVFAINGVGQLLVASIARRDFAVVQGTVLFIAFNFVAVNLLIDVLFGIVDPRIRYDTQ